MNAVSNKTTRNLLSQKAMLASVNIGGWSARKYDDAVTKETNKRHAAGDDAGRYNKLLINKEAIGEINRIMGAARAASYKLTMPWLDEGTRILPSALFDEYSKTMRGFRVEYQAAVKKFSDSYPQLIEDAKERLKGMFNSEDYPHPDEMTLYDRKSNPWGRFYFDVVMMPCPDAQDFRVDLADEHAQDIRDDIEARMKDAMSKAMWGPLQRIVNVAEAMVERLGAYKPAKPGSGKKSEGTFKDSLVENVRELVELLPAFNIAGDKAFADLTKRIKDELCAFDADVLRDDAKVRANTKKAAKEILEKASELMG